MLPSAAMRAAALVALALLTSILIAGCGDHELVVPVDEPSTPTPAVIEPAGSAPAGSTMNDDGFYWLAPISKDGTAAFSGTFDAGLLRALSVRICELEAGEAACARPVRVLTASSRPPEHLRVDPEELTYSANWRTTSGLTAGKTYRVFVTADVPSRGIVTVGWIDLVAAAKNRDLQGARNRARLPGFVIGKPVLIKFRLQAGLPGHLDIDPESAELGATGTASPEQVFTATLTDLHGDPLPGRTIDWSSSAPLVHLDPTSGQTDGSGRHTVTATAAGPVATDTDVSVTAAHGALSAVAVLTLKAATCSLSSTPDTDGDRLPDCVETDTGVFVSQLDTGTDPRRGDTDADAISDGDEVLGTRDGLDLPAFGVSPLVPTILIEHDYFIDSGHSHAPRASVMAMVEASFAANGIQVISDRGQGPAPFNGGNLIDDDDGNVDGLGPEFYAYKAQHFAANRQGYFHYALHTHTYNHGFSSGLAEIRGDDFIVSMGPLIHFHTWLAGTIQHELGHNLGLRHGGADHLNWKPNYNSVMNYNYQFSGVDSNCTPPGDGVVDYSNGGHITLNENHLIEDEGICGNPPGPGWDWNNDGDVTDVPIEKDLTRDGLFHVLVDYNDWAFLTYSGIHDFGGAGVAAQRASTELIECQDLPVHLLP